MTRVGRWRNQDQDQQQQMNKPLLKGKSTAVVTVSADDTD
jgi:hypothetical protein